MENQENKSSSLKVVVAILVVLLLLSFGYIFKLMNDNKVVETKVVTERTEKDSIMSKLKELNTVYDAAIAENTTMSDELIAEKEKVQGLIAQLQKSKGDVASLSKFKKLYADLELKMKSLLVEVDELKVKNQKLTTNLDSTTVVLQQSKTNNQNLVSQNEELAKTVEKGAKLSVLNLKTTAYIQRGSGKQIETDKASRADFLRISFLIAENSITKSGDKIYHVQVIDSKNNVLGDKATATFGDKSLTYSFTSTVKYENKTVQVSQDLQGKDFEKGTYFVNVFDKNELVSKTSFTLR